MIYLDGGATHDGISSAINIYHHLRGLAVSRTTLATGYGYGKATDLVTLVIGALIDVVGGGYFRFVALQYVGAFGDVSDIIEDHGNLDRARVRTTTLFGAITRIRAARI